MQEQQRAFHTGNYYGSTLRGALSRTVRPEWASCWPPGWFHAICGCVGVSWTIETLAFICSVHLDPPGLQLFGAAYTVKLSCLCSNFIQPLDSWLFGGSSDKSAQVNSSVSSWCFIKSGYVKYIRTWERLKTSVWVNWYWSLPRFFCIFQFPCFCFLG